MPPIWKTIPLFISSTFRDMHAERDQLNRVVFPAIEERLKPRRCRVVPIDLRVGVETDSTQTERERELQILKVCLAEIERSRPFLLVLLGDRYGWVPGEDRIKAASSEAGFTQENHGGSVTALEIDYGLLKKAPSERRRCLICIREPLPYHRMPDDKATIYSDAHATDPGARDRVARLQKLKARINADPELAPHRHPYKLDWDETKHQPKADGDHGIEAWGQKVEEALWALLNEETKSFAAQAEPTWEERERFAIEEQVERLNSSFVGRQPLIQRALELAGSVTTQGVATGLIFTGGSGTGKSALFARLHHELSMHPSILLLAHTAGVSPKSCQTEWMLRRWISELGAALRETPDVPVNIKPEDLEKLFSQFLHRVAATHRVVVLVDALNQFLRTERARTVSWLPVDWPANVRFIATTIPGEESIQLARRPGLALVEVPPLDNSEAGAVAAQVYGRYRRTPNAGVLNAVLALRQSDGTPAAGNPLWLTLALDLLNLLDADDFTAAEAAVGDSPEEKLRRLVLDLARALPPDMEGLYRRLLAQVEKVAGLDETRAFAALTALSRHGWREEDLQCLLPKAADLLHSSVIPRSSLRILHSWDPLRFAILRRCFRAHLVKRGALEQWDFAHATLRQAVRASLSKEWKGESTTDLGRALYACGADYLQTSLRDHALGKTELLWHILGTRDSLRAATYYASGFDVQNFMKIYAAIDGRLGRMNLRGGDHVSSENLAAYLLEDWTMEGRPLLSFVTGWLTDASLPDAVREGVAFVIHTDLQQIVAATGHLALRQFLVAAAVTVLGQRSAASLEFTNVDESERTRNFASGLIEAAEVLRQMGDLGGAMGKYEEALRACTEHGELNVVSPLWQIELAGICHHGIGLVLRLQEDLPRALNAFQAALRLCEIRSKVNLKGLLPSKSVTAGQCHQALGDVLMAQGNLSRAIQEFRAALQADETL